jgi:penicillin amidase
MRFANSTGTVFLTLITLSAAPAAAAEKLGVEGLKAPALLARGSSGIVHITAANETSLTFAQGYVHARDRLFQMDLLRRTASGTLAELLGDAVLADDIELRTIGLRRAAERTVPALQQPLRNALEAYAKGVNAYIDEVAKGERPLPPEYGVLGFGAVDEWSVVDSVAIAKLVSFQLSADLEDIDRTNALIAYRSAFSSDQGKADALFFQDLWRVAPFEPIATVPDWEHAVAALKRETVASTAAVVNENVSGAIDDWQRRIAKAPRLRRILNARADGAGSNAFVVSGKLTRDGQPLLANDPHLELTVPSVFYPVHLRTPLAGFDVRGASFAGVPYIAQGVTPRFAWGVTTSGVDVTDVYQEQLVPDPASPSGFSTLYAGATEHVLPVPQVFRVNRGGTLVTIPVAAEDGGLTLIVPRRNQGPIIATAGDGTALSLQWAGFGPTFEIEAFRGLSKAKTRRQFEAALQSFDVGSQNFLYADRSGTIAYYLSGEIPLREDLQSGKPLMPPFLVRSGQGGQEWIPSPLPPQGQSLPYLIVPWEEMPKAINPGEGYLISANNDPVGDTFDNNALNQTGALGGIRYLGADFNIGIRAQRIEDLILSLNRGKGLSFRDMQTMQADVTMRDAAVFVDPFILQAFDNAKTSTEPRLRAFAEDAGVAEAVQRLRRWQYTAPTGVEEGFDGVKSARPRQESVAATIYSLWRAEMIANTIDATLDALVKDLPKPSSRYAIRALRHLLDTFDVNQGIGASGLDFFAVDGVADAATRRDIIILKSIRDALDRLASADLAPAFGGSVDQRDYLWGRLHRLEIEHPLGRPFSFTSTDGPFPPPFDGLPGIPVDGGFETVDRSTHDVRAGLEGSGAVNDFVFSTAPADRFVARPGPRQSSAEIALPGGVSGVLGSEFYANLLGSWLINEASALAPCGDRPDIILLPKPGAD